ncbi:calcineurin-like phosphoesterase family protein [Reichenbachiella sp.]|uniref:calcineurin-like phosphoesterase family protein n=1 Tax=Reichenbachiella sp. TaxID=2184521 RepID=UPI0032967FB9
MMNQCKKVILVLCFIHALVCPCLAQQILAEGVVTSSINDQKSQQLALGGVGVSNGKDVVITDAKGQFKISLSRNELLFVILPSGYNVPVDQFNIPKFYFTHKELSSGTKAHFRLQPSNQGTTFKVAMLGDLQMRIQEEINYANRLLTPELFIRNDIDLAIMLGDIADDSLNILAGTRQITKHFPMPAYGVFGNHDRDLGKNFTQSYKAVFGPDYYAFNRGKVHFIVVNNILPTEDGDYEGVISKRQLAFIKNDLEHTPEDYLIVFCQHIPIHTLENREELFELLENRRRVLAVSGHRHILEQEFVPFGTSQELHEVVAGAVCGLWWDGERDWKGIPVSVMGFGAPKGYYVFTFEDDQYSMRYKALELPVDKQINIWTWYPDRGDIANQKPKGFQGNEILANVFAGSERTQVSMSIDGGEWVAMKKTAIPDPYVARIIESEKLGIYPTQNQIRSGLKTENSKHIWLGYYPNDLKEGSHRVEVVAQDEYGLDAYEVSFFMIGN